MGKNRQTAKWQMQDVFARDTNKGVKLVVEVHRDINSRYPRFSMKLGALSKGAQSYTMPFAPVPVKQTPTGTAHDNTAEVFISLVEQADDYIAEQCLEAYREYSDWLVERDQNRSQRDYTPQPYEGKRKGNRK